MKRLICISLIIILHSPLFSTNQMGGEGLIYVQSARVMPAGWLTFHTGTRFYGKIARFSESRSAYTLWVVQGYSSFNVGISNNVELAIAPVFYQDTNNNQGNVLDGQGNFPDDIFVGIKFGSFRALERPLAFGSQIYTRIPTASAHNIIYEPYSAGTVEIGIRGLVSYFNNTIFPDESWSLHANLGYLNHNDVGAELTENAADAKPQTMSSQIQLGAGILYPMGAFDFSGEINAHAFLTRPPETAYSREYSSYLTAGVHYKPAPWATFNFGVDLLLFGGEDLTEYENTALSVPPADFPNYPTWRMSLGAKIAILPFSRFASSRSDMEKRATDRREMLRRILQGEKGTEEAQDELSRIRTERQKVEDELRRLRQLLEKEKEKK